ncbi:unnamed protein product [Haemonchus placei]|uniref:Secreted protein n=1 Tax=Haemonchus placei TaxID=6290 RepID=A0A0N4VS45_HAEPC|nr:unnamed protein product [Haemonchus placei]
MFVYLTLHVQWMSSQPYVKDCIYPRNKRWAVLHVRGKHSNISRFYRPEIECCNHSTQDVAIVTIGQPIQRHVTLLYRDINMHVGI